VRTSMAAMVCALALAGCRQPRQVSTDSRITITGPVTAEVSADMQTATPQPLVQMAVEGQGAPRSAGKIALVDVDGVLVNADLTGPYSAGENPVALFREKLQAAAADPRICAVVVRINSPGGGVTATDIMWRELQEFRQRAGRPVVACLMDVGTGGAYYLATATDVIYAHPTTVTGGLGVILNLYNLQDAMAQFNVLSQPVKSGQNIDMGTPTRPLTAEQRAWFQAMANEFHQRLERIVRQSRPHLAGDKPEVFDGRVFTAEQARGLGLIDRIGYLDDAIAAARQEAGLSEARVVMFHRPNDPARTPLAATANVPPFSKPLPVSVPGIERTRLPAFLYMWLPDPTLERITGPW
jgi:protease-4